MKLILKDKIIELEIANTFFKRFKGFMFQFSTIQTGIVFPKTRSIHTFFMFQPIDVIMTDKNQKILYMWESLNSENIILPKKNVYYTYELPINSINGLQLGDILNIEKTKK